MARRLVCDASGRPPRVRLEVVPDPTPAADGLVVRVRAANLAYVDLLLVEGGYQFTPEPPFTPGTVVVGEVIAAGPEADLPVGLPIAALSVGFGAYATLASVPALAAVPLPRGPDSARAAVALESYGTADNSLGDRARLAQGERVLVLGAGGGVGQALLDTARDRGAETIAVVSTPAGAERARALGAGRVIDRTVDDLRSVMRAEVPEGVDVVADPVGRALSVPALRSLGFGGRYLAPMFHRPVGGEVPVT